MENNNKIINSIIHITHQNIKIDDYEILQHTSIYSNTKIPIYKIKINNNIISRSSTHIITYQCINCAKLNKISLTQYLRKLNKQNNGTCKYCRNKNDKKRAEQSKYMKNRYKNNVIRKEKICIGRTFDDMSKSFKDKYTQKHLSETEFNAIKNKIITINGVKIHWDKCVYVFARKVNNQTAFNPYLYNTVTKSYIKPIYILWKCEVCDNNFTNRDLYVQKKSKKILCRECKMCNKVFKIKETHNIHNTKILWQSKLELQFITWCNAQNIVIENGPVLSYYFDKKNRRYKLDFQLPDIGMLIEIKDNHCWHKQQVKNGKWNAKETVANQFVKNSDIYDSFDLVFPKDFKYIKDKIIDKI